MKSLFLLLVVLLILGCTAQTVKNGDSVSVTYNVSDENGTLLDNNNNEPFNFTIGGGAVIKGFNYAVIGMAVGDKKTVTIPYEEAYGGYVPSKVKITTVQNMEDTGITPDVGTVVYATVNQNRERGLVTENNGTHVWVDFNHPLAGKTLVFQIQLMSINSHSGNAI